MQKIKAFIIHLGRAESRRAQVETLRRTLPVKSMVIPAVDGNLLDDRAIHEVYRRRLHRPVYPLRLSRSEIACFMSHRKTWQMIVDQKLDAGLVFEDDAAPDADFAAIFDFARQHMTKNSYIRFSIHNNENGPVLARKGSVRLIRPVPVRLGTIAQLVSIDAARQLLDATRCFDRPVDTMLQLFWITGVRPTAILPSGIHEISSDLGGSTLEKKRKIAEKLYREIVRPVYRAKVAFQSRLRN